MQQNYKTECDLRKVVISGNVWDVLLFHVSVNIIAVKDKHIHAL